MYIDFIIIQIYLHVINKILITPSLITGFNVDLSFFNTKNQ